MRAANGKQPISRGRTRCRGPWSGYVWGWILAVALLSFSGCARAPRPGVPVAEVPGMSTRAEAAYYYLTYQDQLLKGNATSALEALHQAQELDPSPELSLELASQYWRREAFDRAEDILKSALEKFPGHRRLSLTLSRFYVDQDQKQKALEVLNYYVANHPQDLVGLRHLARLYLNLRDYEKARAVLNNIPKDEWTADEHYLMAQVYSALENRSGTIQHLKAATRLKPTFVKAWAELGYQHELAKDYLAAEEVYSRLLEMDASNQEIYIRLIELNLKLNDPERALNLVHQAPREDRFVLRSLALFLQNDFYESAARLLSDFKQQISGSPEGKLYQALTLFKANQDIEGALQVLDSIQAEQALSDQVLTLKARLLWQQGKLEPALRQAQLGQDKFPEQERFWLLKSDILSDQGATQQALEVLEEARQRFPESVPVLFSAGVLEHERGRRKQAIALMERILELEPEHAGAMNFIGYSLVEEQEEMARAFELITAALEHDPNNGYYLDSLAWYHYQAGNIEKAWSTILSAVSAVDDDPVIWEHYAEIALELQKMKQAAEGFRKALELGHDNRKELEQGLWTA